jgi:N-acetylglucosamine malate deacetylase 2
VKQIQETFGRVLILAAHPDDETIACSGLLQRSSSSMVIFAVDGAPRFYHFERKFRSLENYSQIRSLEACRALERVSNCTFVSLERRDGTKFNDQHLFLELPTAFESLLRIAAEFSPDLLISHALEGGHVDHDACHVLARQAARELHLPAIEFPLYWKSEEGQDVFQRFRKAASQELVLELSSAEKKIKRKMLAEYRTQKRLLAVFDTNLERFRPMSPDWNDVIPSWPGYHFENRSQLLPTDLFSQKVSEFSQSRSRLTSLVSPSTVG